MTLLALSRRRLAASVAGAALAAACPPLSGAAAQTQGQQVPPIEVQQQPKSAPVAKAKLKKAKTPAAPAVTQAPAPAPAATEPMAAEEAPVSEADQSLAGSSLNTTKIGSQTLIPRRSATSDTAALLQSAPGVSIYTAGGVSGLPVIHGLNDERINVTVDGRPLIAACANHMNPPLSYVDPAAITKIEVTAGITPVSAGGDSLGGTVAVETAGPEFARADGVETHGGFSAYWRSISDGAGGSVSASAATRNMSIAYTGAWTQANDYDDGHGAAVGSTLYEASNHAMSLALRDGRDLFIVDGGYQLIPYQGYVNQWMDMTENRAWFVNTRYEGEFDWGKLYAQAFYQNTAHEMDFLDDKKKGRVASGRMPAMPMYTEAENIGYKVKAEIPLSPFDLLRVGNEFHHYKLDDWWPPVAGPMGWKPGMMCCDSFWNVNGGERDRMGTFVEWESKWSREWTTLLGARNDVVWMDTGDVQGYNNGAMTMGMMSMIPYAKDAAAFNAEDHSRADVNFDITALARFEPDAWSAYEFGYARKSRAPSLYERYTWSANGMAGSMIGWFGDGSPYVGNLDLDSETAHTVSVTAGWHDPARRDWEFRVTPYYTYVEDYIGVEALKPNFNGVWNNNFLRFVNHDAELYGVDIAGSKVLWDSLDYGLFAFAGSASYVHGENADTGDPLYHMMPWNARLALQHTLGRWTNAVELELVADKDRVDPLRNEVPTSAYALVNLRTGYEWKNVRFDLGVENLFDRYYEHPLGGVDIGVFPVATCGDLPCNVAGPGRNVHTGVTVTF